MKLRKLFNHKLLELNDFSKGKELAKFDSDDIMKIYKK